MARLPRMVIPHWPLHIVQRGHDRNPIFFSDDDYWKYLHDLTAAAANSGCEIHAYILMTNHVHLLLTPSRESSASEMMQDIGRRYVRFINGKYRRSGSLWEGRFRSCLIQDDTHLLACSRYIEMNPVRANMVEQPSSYPWSSYFHNALGKCNKLISEHATYLALGNTPAQRPLAYREMFEASENHSIINELRTGIQKTGFVGNERFRQHIETMTGRVLTQKTHGGARR